MLKLLRGTNVVKGDALCLRDPDNKIGLLHIGGIRPDAGETGIIVKYGRLRRPNGIVDMQRVAIIAVGFEKNYGMGHLSFFDDLFHFHGDRIGDAIPYFLNADLAGGIVFLFQELEPVCPGFLPEPLSVIARIEDKQDQDSGSKGQYKTFHN